MAPIPRFDEEAVALISAIERRREDIKSYHLPRISTPSPNNAYGAEAKEDLDTLSRLVEELRVMVPDQRGEAARRELDGITTKLEADVTSLRKQVRAALLSAQRSSNRAELFASNAKPTDGKESLTVEDALMKANQDVVNTLHRTLNLMQGELERSVLTTQMLDNSTRTLESTSAQHTTLETLLDSSKALITTLEKTDWLDRILIMLGLLVFGLVCALVIKERVVDRSIRIAFFWTRFIPKSRTKLPPVLPTTAIYEQAEKVSTEVSSVLESVIATETRDVTLSSKLPYATTSTLCSSDSDPCSVSIEVPAATETDGATSTETPKSTVLAERGKEDEPVDNRLENEVDENTATESRPTDEL